jgi:predicted metal-dependent RNase/dsRNA-specific ribonuclease
MTNNIQITCTFAGGADGIGASCTLVEVDNTTILVDCGIRMNAPDQPLPDLASLNRKHLDAIILTHAHTDHTGALPLVCEMFPGVPVYATAPTLDLITILLYDALKIAELERESEIPLYSKMLVERALSHCIPLAFKQPKSINTITCTFLPASHIIGAAMVHLATPSGNVLFTGDYSITATSTMPSLDKPLLPVDMLISESTYGTRLHEDRKIAETRLVDQIREVVGQGGHVLIPSFAIGRAQEVLLILQKAIRSKKLPEIPVYVDGMVRNTCAIYSNYESFVTSSLARQIRNQSNPFFTDTITPVTTQAVRCGILSGGPCIIVASSGMLTGGASAMYAKKMLGNEHDAIFMTGYQDEESPGRKLLSLASGENRTIELQGVSLNVNAKVATFSLSAHADRLQMASFIESIRPRTVVLVHGDNDSRISLKRSLQTSDCQLVKNGESISRSYPLRRNYQTSPYHLPEKDDIDRIRAIIGGSDSDHPVKASDAAQLWFGCRVDALQIDQFVQRLEEMGIVRRDDIRRNFFHVCPDAPADSPEYALEQQLKEQNPKGKLLEFCMKEKISLPVYTVISRDGYYFGSAVIVIDTKQLQSSECKALSKKTAEQMASQELLSLIPKSNNVKPELTIEEQDDIIDIDAEEKEHLRLCNPKGALFEFCAEHKLDIPSFVYKEQNRLFYARIISKSGSFETPWYRSDQKKMAEQGAAGAYLTIITVRLQQETKETAADQPEEVSKTINAGADPRLQLNNLVQTKQLCSFGYTQISSGTIANQTRFTLCAWAELPDNSKIESSPKTASSKKEAQYIAAADLLERFYTLD